MVLFNIGQQLTFPFTRFEKNFSLKIDRIWFFRSSCYVLTKFVRLNCVIISLVIRLTSVSSPRNMRILVHPHRGSIRGTLPWFLVVALEKESTVDKEETGVENCLLQVIFYLPDFHLASCERMIDIGAIESFSQDTFASFTHSLLWMERFSEGRFLKFVHIPSV